MIAALVHQVQGVYIMPLDRYGPGGRISALYPLSDALSNCGAAVIPRLSLCPHKNKQFDFPTGNRTACSYSFLCGASGAAQK